MKKIILLTFILLAFTQNGFANDDLSKAKALAGEANNSTHFLENKGQIKHTDGSDAPYVSYLLQRANTNIYLLSEGGIAYQFNKTHYPEGYEELLLADRNGKIADMKKMTALEEKIRLETYRMDMHLLGANPNAEIITEGKSTGYNNYYNHNTLEVHDYKKVTYKEVYPGIDWVIYTSEEGMKYDFVVQPGADPKQIVLSFTNQEELYLDREGNLIHGNRMGSFTEQAPVSFQEEKVINTKFILEDNQLRFAIENYDVSKPLTIDPPRIWATYYGGTGQDQGRSCVIDGNDNVYLTGETFSTTAIASGGYQDTFGGVVDAYLVKFDSTGARQWATYYGGSGNDLSYSCAADGSGYVYLSGITTSTTAIASGGHQNVFGGVRDAFLVKFDSTGTRQWATYYGGAGDDLAYSCAVDDSDNIYMAGIAKSNTDIASGGHQNTYVGTGGFGDAFLVKFNSAGTRQWATYYGGPSEEVALSCVVDGSDNVYITGQTTSSTAIASGGHQNIYGGSRDAFLVKFDSNGTRQWASYYGGTNEEFGQSCSVDGSDNVYLAGQTTSSTAIASGGHQNIYGGSRDAFLVKFDSNGTRQWASYYGGTGEDQGRSCVIDGNDNVYLSGLTQSTTAIASGGHQNTIGGSTDAFLVKFDSSGSRQWATYYGGTSFDIGYSCIADDNDNVYLSGTSASTSAIASGGHQNINGGGFSDAFLVKFDGYVCLSPTNLTATNITDDAADLGWTSTGTLFDIELGTSGFSPTGTPTDAGVSNPYSTTTPLSSLTTYDFYVRQDCGGGDYSTWAGPFSFTTLPAALPCFAPTNLTATNITDDAADLGWTSFGGSLFDVELGTSGFSPTGTPTDAGVSNPFSTTTPLSSLTTYDFYVRQDCGGGDYSTWTGPLSFTTLPAALPCFAPTNLTATNITDDAADLGWTSFGGSLFDVELGTSGFSPTGTPTDAGVSNPFSTTTPLSSLTTYDFYVRQDCGGGDYSTWTGPLSFTTLPAPPANDEIAGAISTSCGSSITGSTDLATQGSDESGTCGTVITAPGLWYSIVGNDFDITADLCGSSYDTKISVFTGTSGSLTCINGNNDDCGLQSSVTFTSTMSTTYLILVHGSGSATGDFTLNIACDIPSIWTGNTSTDWNMSTNWSAGVVPTATDEIIIPDVSGASGNFPIAGLDITVEDLTVEVGASLDMQPGFVLINNNGTITNNGSITLNADASGTAYYDDFTNGGSFVGELTVEQYVTTGSGLGQRMFGSPVNNGIVQGLDQTYASGSTGQILMSNCATAQVDVGSPYNNLFEWNEAAAAPNSCEYEAWFARTQSASLENGRGYSGWMQDGTVFSFTGTPNTGSLSYGGNLGNLNSGLVKKDGWHVLSNPYPSPINANGLTGGNWNSLQTYDPGQAYGGTFQPILPGDDLGVAQGFVAFTTVNSNTANFTNAMRNTNSATFKSNTNWFESKLDIEVSGNGFKDISYIYFNNDATADFDNQWDCKKKESDAGQPTLFTDIAGEKASLNGLSIIELGYESVLLGLAPGGNGTFTLEVSGISTFPASTIVYLEDKATGTWTNLREQANYSFNMTETEAEDRFEIHFTKPIALSHEAETCEQNDATISVDFGNQTIAGNLQSWDYEIQLASQLVSSGSEANMLELMDLEPGDYEITFTNGNQVVSELITIEDKVQVEADFDANATTLFVGDELSLTNTSNGATSYEWEVNGEFFTTTDLSYTFTAPDTYIVRLDAANTDCDALAEQSFIVNKKTTSIAEQVELNNALIFATGKTITVDLSNVELEGKTDLEIYNMVGKLMVQKLNVSAFEYVDLNQATSGIYIVKIINQKESISRKVILK